MQQSWRYGNVNLRPDGILRVRAGVDAANLWQYCWILLGGSGKSTLVATVYVPSNLGNGMTGLTVWDQQR